MLGRLSGENFEGHRYLSSSKQHQIGNRKTVNGIIMIHLPAEVHG